MKILIIGNGGREHALAWKVAKSPLVNQVYVAPGNAGTALEVGVENINIASSDLEKLVEFAKNRHIDLTLVGPETPLTNGIVDHFQLAGLPIFGPTKAAAQLEGSKLFSKNFLTRHRIPTADFASFDTLAPALAYLAKKGTPLVIKADGLAGGKGVVVAMTNEEAETAIREMLSGAAVGEAGRRVVIEEFLAGEEASFIVMVDGKNVLPMATCQDHKRAFDSDKGPNTGGMGAYSPAPIVSDAVFVRVMTEIIYPTVLGMALEGYPYQGFLYAGLMIDQAGNPKVIEFNCRLGDPETQPMMMRLETDLVELCLAALAGKLEHIKLKWDDRVALGVVMASGGYPHACKTGETVRGLESIHDDSNCKIFIGSAKLDQGRIITDGGRVLCVTALDENIEQTQSRVYENVSKISWPNFFYRHDIGHLAIKFHKQKAEQ